MIVAGFECRDGDFVEMWSDTRPTLFTLSAPYGTWVDILGSIPTEFEGDYAQHNIA